MQTDLEAIRRLYKGSPIFITRDSDRVTATQRHSKKSILLSFNVTHFVLAFLAEIPQIANQHLFNNIRYATIRYFGYSNTLFVSIRFDEGYSRFDIDIEVERLNIQRLASHISLMNSLRSLRLFTGTQDIYLQSLEALKHIKQ